MSQILYSKLMLRVREPNHIFGGGKLHAEILTGTELTASSATPQLRDRASNWPRSEKLVELAAVARP
jgi:hypothetical protein